MPSTFDSFGIRFLYPENWSLLHRHESDENDGVTLELPSGGFFSIECQRPGQVSDEVIEEISRSFAREYGELEREELPQDRLQGVERGVDFRFYYLDLLIISRLLILRRGGKTYLIQIQAESRDFDNNERVFQAILMQLQA